VEEAKWERWSALGALGFVVLVIVIAVLPGSLPKPSDSSAKIGTFIVDNSKELRWSAVIGLLATAVFFWWAGAVWRLVRRGEGGSPRLAVVGLAGLDFASRLLGVGTIILATTAIAAAPTGGGVHDVKFLYLLQAGLAAGAGVGIAVFVAAVSIVMIRARILPAGLGWFGGLVSLVLVVAAGGVASTRDLFFVLGLIGLVGFLLWVVVTAILMLRAPTEPVTVSAA
jgi:hypothetical protein